jgi:hypothetical protein
VQLALIHQSPGAQPLPGGTPVWRTCLREVAFVNHAAVIDESCRVVTGADAYALLVEVVSGLRSPFAGETEVQAQFKAFLASLDPAADGELLSLGQRVLADARLIRRTHLQGVGVGAYGQSVARRVRAGRRVALVGTGALAATIRARLEAKHRIDQWGRRPQPGREGYYLLAAAALRPVCPDDATSLVVAAPASQPDLEAVAGCYRRLMEVIDLRASDHRTPVRRGRRAVTLDDLFRETVPSGPEATRVAAARSEITRLAKAFESRESLRPFGWDDLCA